MNTLASIIAHYAPQQRAGLLPALQAVQVLEGYLSRDTLAQVARGLGVPLADAYGVATFYSMLYTEPIGRKFIRVCDDVICQLAGASQLIAQLEMELGIRCGESTPDGVTALEAVPCLGACHRAPAVLADATLHAPLVDASALIAVALDDSADVVQPGPHLLREIGVGELHDIAHALQHGRYDALHKALHSPREQIVADVKAAGLVGRGGAAFPTGVKWEGAAREITTRDADMYGITGFIICNADESETGTFKDRILMERDPHCIVEAMTIAAYATGANRGLIYVRGEYPLAFERLSSAIVRARERNLLGHDILGSEFHFDIEMRSGAGAYICGEETALLESIEGKRGEPRVKPPFPITYGLFGKPTVINNVETLANVPGIIQNGVEWYRQWGTQSSPGTRLVCLSGCVKQAGLYEISMGQPLREVIFDLGGGLHEGRALQAVLVGGAAGAFLTPAQLDVPMDFQSLASIGATFGSGAVMVFDDSVNLWNVMRGITKFFAHESCGKCYPCQLGTQRQMEIVARIADGETRAADMDVLRALGQTMRDASLCGLGQTAASALLSGMDQRLIQIEGVAP